MKAFNMFKQVVFLWILCSNIVLAQSNDYFAYYRTINAAELSNTTHSYAQADSLYQISFNAVPRPFNQDLFLAAVNASALKDYQKVKAYLEHGFSLGLQYKQVKKHPIYSSLKSNIKRRKLKKEFKLRHKIYKSKLDARLVAAMQAMDERDQEPRQKKYDKMPWKEQQQYMKAADSINYTILKSYLEQGIFFGVSTIGENNPGKYAVADLSLLMRHMSAAHLKELKPYFIKAIKEGEMRPWYFASAYDYTDMYKTTIEDRDENGRPILIIQQTYGTFYFTNDDQKLELYAIENLENAKVLRAEIGLDSMEEYALKEGLKLPIEGEFKKTF